METVAYSDGKEHTRYAEAKLDDKSFYRKRTCFVKPRRATCRQQLAHSNLRQATRTEQLAQSNLHRVTCTGQLAEGNLQKAPCTEQLAQSLQLSCTSSTTSAVKSCGFPARAPGLYLSTTFALKSCNRAGAAGAHVKCYACI